MLSNQLIQKLKLLKRYTNNVYQANTASHAYVERHTLISILWVTYSEKT